MSSTNPVFILPGALRERADSIAAGLYASFTLGAGQFCTKPGLVFLPALAEASDFIKRLQLCINESAPFHLLTSGIRSSYGAAISARKSKTNVGLVAEKQPTGIGENSAWAARFSKPMLALSWRTKTWLRRFSAPRPC
jgi:2,5-dioxopentanoate dehydrogenase